MLKRMAEKRAEGGQTPFSLRVVVPLMRVMAVARGVVDNVVADGGIATHNSLENVPESR